MFLGVDEVPSQEKVEKVKQIKKWFEKADSLLVVHYVGLKVSESAELRAMIKGGGNELRVLKNTLTRIALEGTDMQELTKVIDGPSAFVFINEDLAGTARALRNFAKGRKGIYFQGGMLHMRLLNAAEVDTISTLPPREVLLAQMAGQVVGQLTGVVNIVVAPARKMLSLMRALSEKREKEGPPPASAASEAPAEEAPARETTIEETIPEESPGPKGPSGGEGEASGDMKSETTE